MTAHPDPTAPSDQREPEPTDAEIFYCATHPKVETGLRCGRCDTPICPRCLVMTPVGARCRECARLKPLPMFVAGPSHYALAIVAGLGVAALGSIALLFLPPFGFLTLLLYAGFGLAVGEAVSRATNRKRAKGIAVVAACCAGIGSLAVAVAMLGPAFGLIGAILAAVVAWGRVR